MLDINLFRNDLAAVAAGLAKRGVALDTARFEALEARAQGHPDAHAGAAGAGATRCRSRSAPPRARARTPRRCWPRSAGIGDETKRLEGELDRVQARAARFPARPAQSPAPERARRHVRRRQRRGAPLGHAARVRLPGQGPHRPRRGARPARFRDRGEALRRALLVPARRPRAPAPRARAVHARHADARARLHRVLHAVHRQRRDAGRHDAAAEVRGRHVLGEEGRRGGRGRAALPDLDRRDHAHQHRARRDPRRRRAADQADRALAVLPLRSRAATARTRAA